jgi:hypothetical protein
VRSSSSGRRSQVAGRRSQVAGRRSQVVGRRARSAWIGSNRESGVASSSRRETDRWSRESAGRQREEGNIEEI